MCALEEVSREGKGRARGRIGLENIKCQLGTLVGGTEAGDAPIQGLPAPKRESWCQDPSSVPCPAHLLRSGVSAGLVPAGSQGTPGLTVLLQFPFQFTQHWFCVYSSYNTFSFKIKLYFKKWLLQNPN